jgi:ATP-dependent helicase Lhr and Lhr-like helicase
MNYSTWLNRVKEWFHSQGRQPFEFQTQAWEAVFNEKSGVVNAPTGCGKTFSVWLGCLGNYASEIETGKRKPHQLHTLWITPLRALSREIESAMTEALNELSVEGSISVKTGDSTAKERAQFKKKTSDFLITTPESLHLLLAQKGCHDLFKHIRYVVVDEWHELLGSKRGVQVELALSRLKSISASLSVWGISATIGNMDEALRVLMGNYFDKSVFIKAAIEKKNSD